MSDTRRTQQDDYLSLADQLAAIKGLTFAHCVDFFREQLVPDPQRQQIIDKIADAEIPVDEGTLEVDYPAFASESGPDGDNGAYIMCWYWVSYAHTPLDKDAEDVGKSA